MTDKEIDRLLYELSPSLAKRLADEVTEEDENDEEIVFSERHKQNMQKLFAQTRKMEKHRKRVKYARRIAVVALFCIIACGTTIFGVEALRVKFLNYIVDIQHNHTEINFSDKVIDKYESDEICIQYIPEGFALAEVNKDGYLYLKFRKDSLYFSVSVREDYVENNIDTENAEIQNITVNGYDAFLSKKKDVNILVFRDQEVYYTISGNIDADEIMKIADSIE